MLSQFAGVSCLKLDNFLQEDSNLFSMLAENHVRELFMKGPLPYTSIPAPSSCGSWYILANALVMLQLADSLKHQGVTSPDSSTDDTVAGLQSSNVTIRSSV